MAQGVGVAKNVHKMCMHGLRARTFTRAGWVISSRGSVVAKASSSAILPARCSKEPWKGAKW